MKKIFTAIVLLAFMASTGYSQDGFRFGMKVEPSLNWYKPDNKKKFENGGIVPKFTYGFITEFPLSDIASLSTGLEVTGDGGKLNFLGTDTAMYMTNSDDEFLPLADSAMATSVYTLNSRTYKNQYVTLPMTLKMKTNELGSMTYYGEFGFLLSIKWKAKVDDNVTNAVSGDTFDQKDLDNTKDMGFMNIGLKVGGGAEMNISGSTALVMGVSFSPGFLNVLQGESEYLLRPDAEPVDQKANSSRVALTLGILF